MMQGESNSAAGIVFLCERSLLHTSGSDVRHDKKFYVFMNENLLMLYTVHVIRLCTDIYQAIRPKEVVKYTDL